MIRPVRGRVGLSVVVGIVGSFVTGCMIRPAPVSTVAADPPVVVRRTLTRHVDVRRAPEASRDATPARAAAARTATPSPWQQLDVALSGPTVVVARARGSALPVSVGPGQSAHARLSNPTKVGAPRVVVVVADAGDWLQVLLPLRPNGSVGWVQRSDVELSTITQRVEIDRQAHRLRMFESGALVLEAPVAVGRVATPTPGGQFFVTELLRPPNPAGAYGPYAFTLSAYSNVYQRFGSGDGAVGLHGTNEPRAIGTDASHGCIRVTNDVIARLAATLPLGTPVLIR